MKHLFEKNLSQSVFVNLLQILNVKHTKWFAEKYFREHPHKDNLYGISKMLFDYKIDNAGFIVDDKAEKLTEIKLPFVAYLGTDFVVVFEIKSEKVNYLWRNERIVTTIDKFLEIWSGIVLIVESNKESIEPNYENNHKIEIIDTLKKILLILCGILFIGVNCYLNAIYSNFGMMLSLFINLVGIYVGWLLVSQQIYAQGNYIDKICSLLLRQSNCNNILDSKAAKLFGIISWSEIGLGYFISNVFVIVCFPKLFNYLFVINICSLPFSVWSIWYQKRIAKQWCSLCLLVQILLWLLFIINFVFGLFQFSFFNISDIILIGCVFLFSFLCVNLILSKFSLNEKIEQITQEFNHIKALDMVFISLLKSNPLYEIDKSVSKIIWGDIDAKNILTIITNPHCNPCSKMHERLKYILDNSNNNLCIQYIFTSFNIDLEDSCKYLIAIYQNKDLISFLDVMDKWFNYGRYNRKIFFQEYILDLDSKIVNEEFEKHKKWVEKSNINATPTILFNGYELPENYKVEDLVYFTNLEI